MNILCYCTHDSLVPLALLQKEFVHGNTDSKQCWWLYKHMELLILCLRKMNIVTVPLRPLRLEALEWQCKFMDRRVACHLAHDLFARHLMSKKKKIIYCTYYTIRTYRVSTPTSTNQLRIQGRFNCFMRLMAMILETNHVEFTWAIWVVYILKILQVLQEGISELFILCT